MINDKPTAPKNQVNTKPAKSVKQQSLLQPTAYGNQLHAITPNAPDLNHVTEVERQAHIAQALRLMFRGTRDEERVAFGHSWQGVYRYLDYQTMIETVEEQAKWLSESKSMCTTLAINPLRSAFRRTAPGRHGSCDHTIDNISRLRILAIDIDRIKELKKAGPPDQDQLKMMEQAKNDMVEALTDLGFTSFMITFSGNGWHVVIPIELPNTEANAEKLNKYIDLLRPYLESYPQLALDATVTTPKSLLGIAGTINRKFPDSPSLRWCINIDQLSEESMDAARQPNTELVETILAEQVLSLPINSQPQYENHNPKHSTEMAQWLDLWDADNPCVEQLLANGYTRGGVSKATGGVKMSRPGKSLKEGVSLIVGGKRDVVWNWSTSDATIPEHKVIKPYWLHLLFSGIVNREFQIVNDQAYKDFFSGVRTRYGTPREMAVEHKVIKHDKPALAPVTRPLAKPTTVATDTLSSYKPTGIIAAITAHLDRINPMIAGSINKANAIACVSHMIGKSRVGPTGLPSNVYIVLLSPSSGGKDSGRSFIQEFNEEIDEAFLIKTSSTDYTRENLGYTIAAGSGGTSQGVFDQLLLHGSMLVLGDESARFIHPSESDRPEDKQMRDFFLTASSGKAIPGRAKANNESRPKITRPFVSQLHTTQPATYFSQLQSSNIQKGMVGRFFHAATEWAKINRNYDSFAKIPTDLITRGVYWREQNLLGFTEQKARIMGRVGEGPLIPLLGKFCPTQTALKFASTAFEDRWHDYREYCAGQHRERTERGQEAEGLIWSRMAENAMRYAQVFSLSDDHNATVVDPKHFDTTAKMVEESCALIRAGIIKSEDTLESKLRDRVYYAIVELFDKMEAASPDAFITKRELFRKVEHFKGIPRVGHLDTILHDLRMLGKITTATGHAGAEHIFLEQ